MDNATLYWEHQNEHRENEKNKKTMNRKNAYKCQPETEPEFSHTVTSQTMEEGKVDSKVCVLRNISFIVKKVCMY